MEKIILQSFDTSQKHLRFNSLENTLSKRINPLKEVNGMNYTEDFDCVWKRNEINFYCNLKMICSTGGS